MLTITMSIFSPPRAQKEIHASEGCIKRRCIIRRWKDLRLAAYSFWYLIEKSLVFC